MRSIAMTVLVAGVALTLSGCIGAGEQTQVQNREQERAQQEERMMEQSGLEAWKEALTSGKKMRCQYTMKDEAGKESTVKMTMQKERYRAETVAAGATYTMIFDGNTTYSWMGDGKQGMKMDQACLAEMEKSATADTPVASPVPEIETPEEVLASAPNISCEEAPEADFAVPSDIAFTDQCAMLREQQKLMERYRREMPAGVPGAGSVPGAPVAY